MSWIFFIVLAACSGRSTDSAQPDQNDDTADVSTELECEERTIEECEASSCNLISGYPATENEDGFCIDWSGDPQPAGCSSMASPEAVISFAEDANGTCWAFPSGTTPPGWSECATIDECPQN